MIKYFSVLMLLLSIKSFSDQYTPTYTYEHPTCNVSLHDNFKEESFKELVVSLLKERSYNISFLKKRNILKSGDLHLLIKKNKLKGKMWKDCVVEAKLYYSKNSNASLKDDVIFKKKVKRQYPRVTFSGNERCERALKDSFIHIPHCLSPGGK